MGNKPPEKVFWGIAVSPGIAIGDLVFTRRKRFQPRRNRIASSDLEKEWQRFLDALEATKGELQTLRDNMMKTESHSHEAAIFEVHQLVLEDESLLSRVRVGLEHRLVNVEAIFSDIMSEYTDNLGGTGDSYLRERVLDIEDVSQRVLKILCGGKEGHISHDFPHIVFAHDLTPSAVARIDRDSVLGFATEVGSYTSHTAIIARAFNIPAVVGLELPRHVFLKESNAILDGIEGRLITNPDPETIREFEALRSQQTAAQLKLETLSAEPACTEDGTCITLSANIEFTHEIESLVKHGAEGVGLYRTEFLFLETNEFPDEEKQTAVYSEIAAGVNPHGVIIRTLDIGGDKLLHNVDHEMNPFLGWRGIRLTLDRPNLFKTQLRSILRASEHGKVSIMYPMISSLTELRNANQLLQKCRDELSGEGLNLPDSVEVGCIIELPSAALTVDLLAPEVDFISVGTNDLTQYTLAVDRVNEKVAHLYQPAHPGMLRLLKQIADAAHNADIWAGVCGEMAGETLYTPLLLGLGYDELSVGPSQILKVKSVIRHVRAEECRDLVAEALAMSSVEEIVALCAHFAQEHYPQIL